MLRYITIFLLLFLFAACASPKHRAKKDPETFNSLHEEWQALVLKGKIAEGMGTDALHIAMGKPTLKKETQFMDRQVMGWIYTRLDSYHVPNYEYSVHHTPTGEMYVTEHYMPMHRTRRIPSIVVFVENDMVVGWQDLDTRRWR